ncbi:hypothetical protein LIER_22865 [Lithospermum erythrorhizon]|uniref:Pterin-binding domain-containing protein n=1 Tax=Lithospermum erythrorhizon TaxID=34254 RepID=A0AAV3QVK3_LITER
MPLFNIFTKLTHIKYKLPPIVCRSFSQSSYGSVEVHSQEQEVVIALGSNVGDRVNNFDEALLLMKQSGIKITKHACLYETAPAYVTDQPQFLNSAIRGITTLDPHELLGALKKIEKDLGRTNGIRYGPRPIDLDILFYGKNKIFSDTLTVPHERIWERPFVMAPLVDLLGSEIDSDIVASWHSLARNSNSLLKSWQKLGGESIIGREGMKRVMPIGKHLWGWSSKTLTMGILNLTPDSFSDGGKYLSVEAAVSQVRGMLTEGADIIDLGAQSTRPMAARLSAQEELDRLIPVLEAVAKLPEVEGKFLSIDTFYSQVASEAVSRGAHLINDVSGGTLDPNMHSVVATLRVPYAAMHMRGDPATMQNSKNLQYEDVCKEVAYELSLLARDAEASGIPAWRIILDPGIGFSKTTGQSLDILMGLRTIQSEIARRSFALSLQPLLIGCSRKRFLGQVCDRPTAVDRDPATVASTSVGILNGANIVRVHNVKDNVDAVKLCDALLKRSIF